MPEDKYDYAGREHTARYIGLVSILREQIEAALHKHDFLAKYLHCGAKNIGGILLANMCTLISNSQNSFSFLICRKIRLKCNGMQRNPRHEKYNSLDSTLSVFYAIKTRKEMGNNLFIINF